MQILFIKDAMIYNRYTVAERDYMSQINQFVEKKDNPTSRDNDFKNIFCHNYLVDSKQLDSVIAILNKYRGLGVSSQIAEILAELKHDIYKTDYLVFIGSENRIFSGIKLDINQLKTYNLSTN